MTDDPGVSAERTDLAWTRTALSFLVVGLIGMRLAAPDSAVRAGLVAVAPLSCAAFAASPRARRRTGRRRALAALAAGVAITAIVAALA